jgi:predicted peptidase
VAPVPQTACSFETTGKRGPLRYLLYQPESGDAPRPWPLILFLHGAGERGHDLEDVKRHGIPKIVEEVDEFPFMAVSPQCPPGAWWYQFLKTLAGLVDHILASYPVDARRVYLTGMSMGGYGAWHLAARAPRRFAAIAPVCGGGLASQGFPAKVRVLREVPVWAFHGELDTTVPVEESRRLVNELRACGGDARLTVYPDTGHDCWTRTYEDPALYAWFLEHAR